MQRMIIHYPDGMSASHAMSLVGLVTEGGRVSGPADRKQFCYVSMNDRWVIYSDLTKSRTDVFRIEPNK